MDELQRHCAESKKLVSKGYLLYDSTYMMFSKKKNTVIENRSVVGRNRGE